MDSVHTIDFSALKLYCPHENHAGSEMEFFNAFLKGCSGMENPLGHGTGNSMSEGTRSNASPANQAFSQIFHSL